MQIGSRRIGPDAEPYVIAEIGVNHDGDLGRALGLVDAAADAGVDAVKFQFFEAGRLMSRAARLAAYQRAAGEADPVEMLGRLQLSVAQLGRLVELAHARGVHAIVTVFSLELVPDADALPWDAYKTASPDIVHRPLLEALAATGKPLIVSTGASTLEEIERSLGWLRAGGAGGTGGARGKGDVLERTALLQCVSSYPTRAEDAAIEAMGDLRRIFSGPVGYSDHTAASDTSRKAVMMGACVLEKHFTMDKSMPGPDHAASLEPSAMARYVREAKRAVRLRGEYPEYGAKIAALARAGDVPRKRVLECERDVRSVSRQSITTTRALAAGHVLTLSDVTFKRPGSGLEPCRLREVIGRRLVRGVEGDMPIEGADVGLA